MPPMTGLAVTGSQRSVRRGADPAAWVGRLRALEVHLAEIEALDRGIDALNEELEAISDLEFGHVDTTGADLGLACELGNDLMCQLDVLIWTRHLLLAHLPTEAVPDEHREEPSEPHPNDVEWMAALDARPLTPQVLRGRLAAIEESRSIGSITDDDAKVRIGAARFNFEQQVAERKRRPPPPPRSKRKKRRRG